MYFLCIEQIDGDEDLWPNLMRNGCCNAAVIGYCYCQHTEFGYSKLTLSKTCFLLRQMNEVNGGDNVFIGFCVCQSRVCEANRSIRQALNANSSKMVKASGFRLSNLTSMFLETCSPDMNP